MTISSTPILSQQEATELLFETFLDAKMPEMAARILVVSLNLFAQKGYAATSVREIVQEANVTNPMLYYYFGNKEGVFNKLIDFLFDSMQTQLSAIVTQELSLRERLVLVTRMHFEGCRTLPIAYQFIYAALFGPKLGRPKLDIVCRRSHSLDIFIQMFEDAREGGQFQPHAGFSSAFIAEQYFGLVNNHMMRVLKFAESQDCAHAHEHYMSEQLGEEALKQFIQFFLSGAGTLSEDDV